MADKKKADPPKPGPSSQQTSTSEVASTSVGPSLSSGSIQHNRPNRGGFGKKSSSLRGETYWDGVLMWLLEDKSIAGWLNEEEIGFLVSLPEDQLDMWRVATQYQGFDVKIVLKAMRNSFDNYMKTESPQAISESLRVGDESVPFLYSNRHKMMVDVTFMIFLFSTRGSDWGKVRAKSIKIIQEIMDWLKEKYNIDTSRNLPGISLKPEAITLPRIAACFPMKVCDYFHLGYGKPLCSIEELTQEPGVLSGVSKSILCSYFPACMPSSWVKVNTSVHFVTFWVAVLNDNVLHRSDKKYTPLQNMYSYYSASYKSNATPLKSREAWCKSRGLSNETGSGFLQVILAVSDYCHTAIARDRSDDLGLKAVESQLEALV